MIVCFSGTGNTRRVADQLQDALGDEIVRFAPGLMNNPKKIKLNVYDGRVIWAFPVHSWGMPKAAKAAMRFAQIDSRGPVKHHMVCTCGDDIGYTDVLWRKLMQRRGWHTGSVFSVVMPNTYTFMKGFDVDPPELAAKKLDEAPATVDRIIQAINSGEDATEVVRGRWPWLKSYVARPWFMRFMTSTKPFHYNADCTGCGRCARNCPTNNITMVDKRPVWGKVCTMCLRCYHCCPHHAVEYGRATKGKGQYICPGYSLQG